MEMKDQMLKKLKSILNDNENSEVLPNKKDVEKNIERIKKILEVYESDSISPENSLDKLELVSLIDNIGNGCRAIHGLYNNLIRKLKESFLTDSDKNGFMEDGENLYENLSTRDSKLEAKVKEMYVMLRFEEAIGAAMNEEVAELFEGTQGLLEDNKNLQYLYEDQKTQADYLHYQLAKIYKEYDDMVKMILAANAAKALKANEEEISMLREWESRTQNSKTEITSLRKMIQSKEKEFNKLQSSLSNLQNNYSHVRAELKAAKSSRDDIQEKEKHTSLKAFELSEENSKMKGELEKINTKLLEITNSRAQLQKSENKLKQRVETQRREIEVLKDKLQQSENDLKAKTLVLIAEIQTMKDENSKMKLELEEKIYMSTLEVSILNDQLELLLQSEKDLKNQLKQTENKLKENTSRLESLNEENLNVNYALQRSESTALEMFESLQQTEYQLKEKTELQLREKEILKDKLQQSEKELKAKTSVLTGTTDNSSSTKLNLEEKSNVLSLNISETMIKLQQLGTDAGEIGMKLHEAEKTTTCLKDQIQLLISDMYKLKINFEEVASNISSVDIEMTNMSWKQVALKEISKLVKAYYEIESVIEPKGEDISNELSVFNQEIQELQKWVSEVSFDEQENKEIVPTVKAKVVEIERKLTDLGEKVVDYELMLCKKKQIVSDKRSS